MMYYTLQLPLRAFLNMLRLFFSLLILLAGRMKSASSAELWLGSRLTGAKSDVLCTREAAVIRTDGEILASIVYYRLTINRLIPCPDVMTLVTEL